MQNNRVKKNWNPDAYARHTSFVWELTTILKKRSVKVLGITDALGPEQRERFRQEGRIGQGCLMYGCGLKT